MLQSSHKILWPAQNKNFKPLFQKETNLLQILQF